MSTQVHDFYGMWPRKSAHPQITLTAPNGEQVRVDASVADLHVDLWNAGVTTLASCGGDAVSGAYIMFDSLIDLLNALPIIARHRPDAPAGLESLVGQVIGGEPEPDRNHVTRGLNGWHLSLAHHTDGLASWKWSLHYPSAEGGDPLKGGDY